MPFRVGIGYDVHSFYPEVCSDAYLTICGIKVPHTRRIRAHSDGDVGIHALVDALLGCIGEDGIGKHFSDLNPEWENANSSHFLLYAHRKVLERGYKVLNFDIVLVCEFPKITPHVPQMKRFLADLLQIDISRTNIKAVTSEKLGFIGREEGIAAHAVALCQEVSHPVTR